MSRFEGFTRSTLGAMASTASPSGLESSHPRGRQSISHSVSPAAEDFEYPQVFRFDSTRTSSEANQLSPHRRQASKRRPSLAADDVLPIGLLENAAVAAHHSDTFLDSSTPLRRSVSCATGAQNSMAVDKMQRWSGMTRTVSDWDGLRRVCAETPTHGLLC